MKKLIVLLLLLALPLMFLNGCSKKQEAEKEVKTEQIEKAPADTTVTPPPAEEQAEEAPEKTDK